MCSVGFGAPYFEVAQAYAEIRHAESLCEIAKRPRDQVSKSECEYVIV